MDDVKKWLDDKDYGTGVALYAKHGSSSFLKEVFASGETDYTRAKLEEELSKLSIISRWAIPVDDEVQKELLEGLRNRSPEDYRREYMNDPVPEVPDTSKHQPGAKPNGVKLTEFFIDEAADITPDIIERVQASKPQNLNQNNFHYLKLCRRRDELNRQISRNMVLLDETRSKARRYETAKQIVMLDRKKRMVWDEINYFMEHGSIMPVAEKPKIKTDELQRLYVQINKAEKRLQQSELRNRDKTEKLLKEKRARVEEIRRERAKA